MLKDLSFRAGRRSDKRRLVREAKQERVRIQREEEREKRRLWDESDEGKAAAKRQDFWNETLYAMISGGPTIFPASYERWSPFVIVDEEVEEYFEHHL